MSYTKYQICNLALSHFGQGSIDDLTDESDEKVRLLNLHYDNCLDETLRAFPWNWATATVLLALADDTVPGWTYIYAYPANCVLVRRVYAEGDARTYEKKNFKEFTNGTEKLIATDIEDAYAEYTFRVTDTTMYDPQFISAFSFNLAAKIAGALTGNSAKASEMMQKFQFAVSGAHLTNAVENNDPPKWPTSYRDARK